MELLEEGVDAGVFVDGRDSGDLGANRSIFHDPGAVVAHEEFRTVVVDVLHKNRHCSGSGQNWTSCSSLILKIH